MVNQRLKGLISDHRNKFTKRITTSKIEAQSKVGEINRFETDDTTYLVYDRDLEQGLNEKSNFWDMHRITTAPNEMLKGCIGFNRIMNPIVAALLEFNEAFEIPKLASPGLGPDELIELRIKLLTEEVQEYAEAARSGDLVEVLDALADIGYILAGTIINHGMQDIYDDAFNEVHRSNMAKLVDGKVIRRDDGKVLKPEGWQPPQLAQFVE